MGVDIFMVNQPPLLVEISKMLYSFIRIMFSHIQFYDVSSDVFLDVITGDQLEHTLSKIRDFSGFEQGLWWWYVLFSLLDYHS